MTSQVSLSHIEYASLACGILLLLLHWNFIPENSELYWYFLNAIYNVGSVYYPSCNAFNIKQQRRRQLFDDT